MLSISEVHSSYFKNLIVQTLVEEVPFYNIPDAALYTVIAEKKKRLEKPVSVEAMQRGLTEPMWELLWDCSMPEVGSRPTAPDVSFRTRELATAWIPPAVSAKPWSKHYNVIKL